MGRWTEDGAWRSTMRSPRNKSWRAEYMWNCMISKKVSNLYNWMAALMNYLGQPMSKKALTIQYNRIYRPYAQRYKGVPKLQVLKGKQNVYEEPVS